MPDVIAVVDGGSVVGVAVVSNAVGLNVMIFSLVFGFGLMQSPQNHHKRRLKRLATRGHEQLLPIFVCVFLINLSVHCFVQRFRILIICFYGFTCSIFTIY